jgi:PAS domain S-box-containing protein
LCFARDSSPTTNQCDVLELMQFDANTPLLRALLDQSGVLLAALNMQGEVMACNELVGRLAGGDLTGKSSLPFGFPVRTPGQWVDTLRRVEALGATAVETELSRGDGSFYRVRLSLSLHQHQGEPYILVVGREHPGNPKNAFLEAEQGYRAFIENSSEGIYRVEYTNPIPIDLSPEKIVRRTWEEGVMAECNQALATMRGFQKPDEMIGKPSIDFRLVTREEWQQGIDFVRGGFRYSGIERPMRTASGELRWFRYSALGIVEKGCLVRCWGTVSDVTDRKAMEAELRSLSARQATVLEEERARVAREIHDELGQQLTVLKFEASAWERGKGKPEPGSLTRAIDTAIQTVRRIATELRPVILDEFGLAAAVEWQAGEFSRRTGIECACEVADSIDSPFEIPKHVATTAFRILQEGLTNVARHSGASKVFLRLERNGNRLDLELRDNGSGIAAGNGSPGASLGLAGMRERARDVGGSVLISSVEGQGTMVSASFPLPEGSPEELPL